MYNKIYEAVRDMAQGFAAPFTIEHGTLPQPDSLAMANGEGTAVARYFSRGGRYQLTMLLNGRHHDEGELLAVLSRIHKGLAQATEYPSGDGWSIYAMETLAAPGNFVPEGGSTAGEWQYKSSLRVDFITD